jgi:hypothetical protein
MGASKLAPTAKMDNSITRDLVALTASRRNLLDALDTAMPPLYLRSLDEPSNSKTDC